jgi:(4-O-methyl)-D-glucuronate---lignin esterase
MTRAYSQWIVACTIGLAMVSHAVADERTFFPTDPVMPAFTLPDPLRSMDGTKVASQETWKCKRRPEVLELFRVHVYGRVPAANYDLKFDVVHEDKKTLDGAATLKLVKAVVTRGDKSLTIPFSLFIPNKRTKPAAVFLLICNRDTTNIDPTRKTKSQFWPVEEGIARGYAMAAFHNADVDPDKHDDFKDGIHGLLDEKRGPDSWATIAAWAWGASRIMDYLVRVPEIDKNRVAVIGHSRGGKTALWAGAEDERFALVISNDSGCGGAALSRRKFQGKEQVARINQAFPHWFCERFKSYADKEDNLPVDQHMLMALIAPRAVAVGSALEDKWADPRGEFLSLVYAEPVYALFGKRGLGIKEMPAVGEPCHGDGMHYHLRAGKHDLSLEDWKAYWDFADRALK